MSISSESRMCIVMETKILLTLFLCVVFFIQYLIARAINAREMANINKWDTLRRKWKRARRHRECWLKRYKDIITNAHLHPEYARLWNCEIGAEALYNIEIGSRLEISYDDFKAEQRSLSSQKEWE